MEKKILFVILIMVLMGVCTVFGYINKDQPVVVPMADEIPEPEVKQGQYTIFQYTEVGWTNRLYITEFYIEDDKIFYKLREYDEYLPTALENCLIAPEWIEDINELMNYGFWEPAEESAW